MRIAKPALFLCLTAFLSACAGMRIKDTDNAGVKAGKILTRTVLGVATIGLSEMAIDDEGKKKDWKDACTGKHSIEILTEPSGARIEVNDEFLGEAPLTATVARGCSAYSLNAVTIRALPREAGHCTQGKFISSSDSVPRKVFFDMRLCPINQKLDVNINNE